MSVRLLCCPPAESPWLLLPHKHHEEVALTSLGRIFDSRIRGGGGAIKVLPGARAGSGFRTRPVYIACPQPLGTSVCGRWSHQETPDWDGGGGVPAPSPAAHQHNNIPRITGEDPRETGHLVPILVRGPWQCQHTAFEDVASPRAQNGVDVRHPGGVLGLQVRQRLQGRHDHIDAVALPCHVLVVP